MENTFSTPPTLPAWRVLWGRLEHLCRRGERFLYPLASDCLDLFYPRTCVETGQPVSESASLRYLTAGEEMRLRPVRSPHCPVCGHPFFGKLEEERHCQHCQDLNPAFERGKTAFLMRGIVRRYLINLKYQRQVFLVPDLIALLCRHPEYRDFLRGGTLVPVPLHPSKERHRGFNQSVLVAEGLSRSLDHVAVERVLLRNRPTPTQTRLDRQARAKNVSGAFARDPDVPIDPFRRYILFDDVFTTGATLNACAKVLARAGATRLDVATIAHG